MRRFPLILTLLLLTGGFTIMILLSPIWGAIFTGFGAVGTLVTIAQWLGWTPSIQPPTKTITPPPLIPSWPVPDPASTKGVPTPLPPAHSTPHLRPPIAQPPVPLAKVLLIGSVLVLPILAGVVWVAISHSQLLHPLTGIAWSGSRFVAVGGSGTILTSLDGNTWTAQASGTSQELRGVAWSGSRFVAVGDNGTILTSLDGNTWTAQASSASQELDGVAWSGSRFVAVGNHEILTSPDGNTWTAQASGTSQFLSGVAWSDSRFVAVGWGWNREILTSPDGSTWTTQT
jgi:hypothetical protein